MAVAPWTAAWLLQVALSSAPGPYSGIAGKTTVAVPRLSGAVVIDGVLDEPMWKDAALLTGFSEYAPVDGRPATDSTQVLIWYSPTAIYFGIRAFEAHGPAHASLANRDQIASDDWIEILLDTFNDHRKAMVFGVNPLGVQSDGVLNEIQGSSLDTVDWSQDFAWDSKGRMTAFGYEVEVRVPFKSLRYQPGGVQQWGINILRQVQHSGHEESWTPARRYAPSLLRQSGTLTGLTNLHRDLVLDATPEFTSKVDGAPSSSGWSYHHLTPDLGGNIRWGINNSLTLSGTARPDFSEVEADADQLVLDPREALFFPEKRPFFLEGLDEFDTPNTLIYTRRLVQPVGAVKLTGNLSGIDVGVLSAVDDQPSSGLGTNHPLYNILRARRNVSGSSVLGVVYADRMEGADYNRVAGIDARLAFGGVYTLSIQGAGSFTRASGEATSAPLWQASLDRAGRQFRFTYALSGIAPAFVDSSGFIARAGIATATIDHRITLYGGPGAFLERWTGEAQLIGRWLYPHFTAGRSPDDQKLQFYSNWVLRGWSTTTGVFVESFGYDSTLYTNYAVEHRVGGVTDTVPFTGSPSIRNLDLYFSVQSPNFRRADLALTVIPALQDENFYEWSPARVFIIQGALDWRPSDRLRFNATYIHQQYWRRSDGSEVAHTFIPRLKVEYQVARPIFVRVVAQYVSAWQDSLRDDSRTNDPILIRNAAGVYARAGLQASNGLSLDWLTSFSPTPGTVLYAGYGANLTDAEPFAFAQLNRVNDGFFAKISYLFRL